MSSEEREQLEADLVERLREGESSALGALFDMHRERLWRMVQFRMDRRLSARVDPEDVLQEAFLAAAERVEHFFEHPSGSMFLWLRWVVMQTLIDVHRRHVGAGMRDAGRDVSLEG